MAEANDKRKRAMVERIAAALGGDVSGKTVGFLGATSKPNTDNMREPPSLTIIPALQAAGTKVRAHDPEGIAIARIQLVLWCDRPYHVAEDSDVLVILTERDAYRVLDLERVKELMCGNVIVDLRDAYRPEEVEQPSFVYRGIGRGTVSKPVAATPHTVAE